MDFYRKIDDMRVAKGWSFYKLSQESGLSQQTFTQWMGGKTIPTIQALQSVCNAFGITLAEFFAEDGVIVSTVETKQLMDKWEFLNTKEKESILFIMENYIQKRK